MVDGSETLILTTTVVETGAGRFVWQAESLNKTKIHSREDMHFQEHLAQECSDKYWAATLPWPTIFLPLSLHALPCPILIILGTASTLVVVVSAASLIPTSILTIRAT